MKNIHKKIESYRNLDPKILQLIFALDIVAVILFFILKIDSEANTVLRAFQASSMIFIGVLLGINTIFGFLIIINKINLKKFKKQAIKEFGSIGLLNYFKLGSEKLNNTDTEYYLLRDIYINKIKEEINQSGISPKKDILKQFSKTFSFDDSFFLELLLFVPNSYILIGLLILSAFIIPAIFAFLLFFVIFVLMIPILFAKINNYSLKDIKKMQKMYDKFGDAGFDIYQKLKLIDALSTENIYKIKNTY
jgi:hypothetical protein